VAKAGTKKAAKQTRTKATKMVARSRAKKVAPSRAKSADGQARPGAGLREQASQQIWPMEKDVLFRPDRFKYVRKLLKPDGCVFCHCAKDEPSFDSLCVHQTEHSMIVLNKFPYNSGHLLVLPKRHCGDLLKLSAAEYADMNDCIRLAMKGQVELYQPAGQNIGMNHGAVSGAGIPDHLHYHLIPRWAGDLNFFPLIAETKVVIETLEQSWDRFHAYFKMHPGRTK
jgi:ATP adenylyltransferase